MPRPLFRVRLGFSVWMTCKIDRRASLWSESLCSSRDRRKAIWSKPRCRLVKIVEQSVELSVVGAGVLGGSHVAEIKHEQRVEANSLKLVLAYCPLHIGDVWVLARQEPETEAADQVRSRGRLIEHELGDE